MADKFIEELSFGDSFSFLNDHYILSTDYKKSGDRLGFSLIDGKPRWFKTNDIVNPIPLFTMDKDSNIIAIKETKKDADYQTPNIL
jgi:hypothetical protein